jgi:hypothetical protein
LCIDFYGFCQITLRKFRASGLDFLWAARRRIFAFDLCSLSNDHQCHRLTLACSDQCAEYPFLVLLLMPPERDRCASLRAFLKFRSLCLALSSFLRTVLPSENKQGPSLQLKLHVSSCVYVVKGVQGLVCESCVRLDDAIVNKMVPFPFVVYSRTCRIRPLPGSREVARVRALGG